MTGVAPATNPHLEPITTPAGAGSGQPQLFSSDRGIILSWVERQGAQATLLFSEWYGQEWTKPQKAASGSNWFVNWADVPSVMRLADGTLAAHWLQKSGEDTYAYDVRLSYSTDEGRTWAPSFTPHHDGTKTEHGFASLFQMPGGGLGLAWLDGRATAARGGHDAHGDGASVGAMTIRFAAFDRSWRQTLDMGVDDRVCDCCPTAVAVTVDGPIVAYRDRTEDETRDIHVSRFIDGKWTASTPVHRDGWQIAACPVNGPMLSARGRDVAVAWFTGKGDEGHAYVAFSHNAGATFGNPVRLDDAAALGRVDVELLRDGSAVASWIETTARRTEFKIRHVDRAGTRAQATTIAAIQGSRAAGYPRIAARGDELILAWTDAGAAQSQVRTARFSIK